MRIRFNTLVLTIGLLMTMSLLMAGGAAGLAAQQQHAPIRLQADTFVPAAGEKPQIPPGLTIASYAGKDHGYYIVQFNGPVEERWKDDVISLGGELLGYIPDFAFKVRMNPAQAARAAELDSVAWVGLFQPAYKVSPDADLVGSSILRVQIERGANTGKVTAAVTRSGATILDRSQDLLLVAADAAQLQEIAHVIDVAWIEPFALPQKHVEDGARVILGAETANINGYDGSGVTVAVADTGIGGGTAASAHPDIPADRVTAIFNWPGTTDNCFKTIYDDGAIDVDSGHGTHTAASVLSDGGLNGEGKGVAPAANLVFQATENFVAVSRMCQRIGGYPPTGYFLTGLPDDLHDLYGQAYGEGARVHSNSWGSSQAGVYTVDSANTDDFVWENPDMMITFSAGNEGVDANANGVVDADSIGSPATAKNVLTVGASENVRADNFPCDTGLPYRSQDAYQPDVTCAEMGGTNWLGTWGARYGDSFLAEPLFSDVTAGSKEQMASWSSRGPVDDGRIKPDVVAPGTWILSGYSDLYQEGYDDSVDPRSGLYQWDGWGMPLNDAYKYMGGTSMSNPVAAGAAAVVRDYYSKHDAHDASAALIKATLINSAVDMADENNDGSGDNDFPIPNIHEGWGRVNVENATDSSHQFIDDTAGLDTNGSAVTQFTVASSGQPFKVTLVWSDYASTATAAQNLVNNLDLIVTAPGGAQYLGNVFSGGWSAVGGSADTINNVENVYVQGADAGVWSVQVSAANVPNGPQPFALIVDGLFGAPPPQDPVAAFTYDCTLLACLFDASGSYDNDGTIVSYSWDFGDGSTGSGITAVHTYPAAGTFPAALTVTDNDGLSDSDSQNVTVEDLVVNTPPEVTISAPADGAIFPSGALISFSGFAGDLEDGDLTAALTWTSSIDGTIGSGGSFSAALSENAHTITAQVTDAGGETGSDFISITVEAAADELLHVADLAAGSTPAARNRWDATVTISVADSAGTAVSGALVSGAWSDGASGSASCATTAGGQCAVTLSGIKARVPSVVFTVSEVSSDGYSYDPSANLETSIIVYKP